MNKTIKLNAIRDYVTLNPNEKELVKLVFSKASGSWNTNGHPAFLNLPEHAKEDHFSVSIESDAISGVAYKITRVSDSLEVDASGEIDYHVHIKLVAEVNGEKLKGDIAFHVYVDSGNDARNMGLYNAVTVNYDDGHSAT